MKALVFGGIDDVRLETVPDPCLQAETDALIRVSHTAICGSDLHVVQGREAGLDQGTILGHEFVGEVVECGAEVEGLVVGTRVLSPFTTSCGRCSFCQSGLTSRCRAGQLFGWVADGRGLHGAQAEYVRVPLAPSTLIPLPADISPRQGLLVGDVLATGFYCAQRGDVGPGSIVAVVGCGPVGLMATVAALHLGAARVFALDPVAERRTSAEDWGARAIDPADADALELLKAETQGAGVDVVLEAVGSGPAANLAYSLVRPGGTLSLVGVHTAPAFPFTPAQCYDKNLTVRIGRCPARHLVPQTLGLLRTSKLDLTSVFTHTEALSRGPACYELFAARRDGCIKVLLEP